MKKAAAPLANAMSALEAASTEHDRANLARFGIDAKNALGVSMANMQRIAKKLGPDHALAEALWATGVYEARMLASLIDEPDRVTAAQMERWCRDFDNWAICDTACFKLFDRAPDAWKKVAAWHNKREEFVKRAAFALIASLAGHDKTAGDGLFLKSLEYIEKGAVDERNFVKKGVSWALRSLGRRNAVLNEAAIALSKKLAESDDASARWIGRGALKELSGRTVKSKLAAKTPKEVTPRSASAARASRATKRSPRSKSPAPGRSRSRSRSPAPR